MNDLHWIEVDECLRRGPQPDREDLTRLKARGLTGVVNLRLESELSRELCAEVGLDYHYLPVRDWTAPERLQVEEFLSLFERSRGPLLVHCLGGVGRTGVFVSCYRIAFHGFSAARAIDQSHAEVTWMSMNGMQMEFVHDFADWWRERNEG